MSSSAEGTCIAPPSCYLDVMKHEQSPEAKSLVVALQQVFDQRAQSEWPFLLILSVGVLVEETHRVMQTIERIVLVDGGYI